MHAETYPNMPKTPFYHANQNILDYNIVRMIQTPISHLKIQNHTLHIIST